MAAYWHHLLQLLKFKRNESTTLRIGLGIYFIFIVFMGRDMMEKWKKIWLGILGGIAITGLCYFHAAINPTVIIEARTGNTMSSGPAGDSLQERIAQKIKDQMDQDGTWDITLNSTNQRSVNVGADATTWALGTATYFIVGSNTAATAIGSLTGETAGDVFTIVIKGGGNYSTIADNGGNPAVSAFNIAGQGGFAPDSADDNITFYVRGDNDYYQVYGTQTNN